MRNLIGGKELHTAMDASFYVVILESSCLLKRYTDDVRLFFGNRRLYIISNSVTSFDLISIRALQKGPSRLERIGVGNLNVPFFWFIFFTKFKLSAC